MVCHYRLPHLPPPIERPPIERPLFMEPLANLLPIWRAWKLRFKFCCTIERFNCDLYICDLFICDLFICDRLKLLLDAEPEREEILDRESFIRDCACERDLVVSTE